MNTDQGLSNESKKTVAFAVASIFSRDLHDDFLDSPSRLSCDRLARCIREAGIEATLFAGAYFVEISGRRENSATKDMFDEALSRELGDDYAVSFVTELARLEALPRRLNHHS